MRALIVDDSPSARAQARAALEDASETLRVSFNVDEAENGIEALRVLASEDVHLLIVDLHMPDITGLEVLAFWRTRVVPGERCAVVASTDVSTRDREKAIESGARGFLEKPVTSVALVDVLRGLFVA